MSPFNLAPDQAEVAKDLTRLRSMPGACQRWQNLTGLTALMSLPDVVLLVPDASLLIDRAKAAQARIKKDIGRMGRSEDQRIARMMLAVGNKSWADRNCRIGERRERYISDPRSRTRVEDTLRTKAEARAVRRLSLLLLERHARPTTQDIDRSRWLQDSGLELVTLDFYHAVDWESLILAANEIDLFFTYARSWRRQLATVLPDLRQHSNARLRLILPSIFPPRTTAIPEIAKRAGQPPARVTEYVAGAYAFYDRLKANIYTLDAAQLYASYRFDSLIVATLYNHQQSQTEGVPTLVCKEGGSLYQFFSAEFERMVSQKSKLTRRLDKNWRVLCSEHKIEIIES
jgi:hypothetical protein